jgi:hypothetical protein
LLENAQGNITRNISVGRAAARGKKCKSPQFFSGYSRFVGACCARTRAEVAIEAVRARLTSREREREREREDFPSRACRRRAPSGGVRGYGGGGQRAGGGG